MKISVLLLTHNRPLLFKRCIDSLLHNLPDSIEILVNNDSSDIVPVIHPQVSYFYFSDDSLSSVYKFLFDKASNEYIFFLEDDDFLVPDFWSNLSSSFDHSDLFYMNFITEKISDQVFPFQFKIESENNLFQLSQLIFKKNTVSSFPSIDHLHNDWFLFQNILSNISFSNIKLISIPMFAQTVDGKDNISFKQYCSDIRFKNHF
jgi:glycosyltransferase involved in cell wall biosynthesis